MRSRLWPKAGSERHSSQHPENSVSGRSRGRRAPQDLALGDDPLKGFLIGANPIERLSSIGPYALKNHEWPAREGMGRERNLIASDIFGIGHGIALCNDRDATFAADGLALVDVATRCRRAQKRTQTP